MAALLLLFYPACGLQLLDGFCTRVVRRTAHDAAHGAVWEFDLAVVPAVVSALQTPVKDFGRPAQPSPMFLPQYTAF